MTHRGASNLRMPLPLHGLILADSYYAAYVNAYWLTSLTVACCNVTSMQEGYTKLFSSITDSTIWQEDNETRLVWVTLLAMSNADGYVGAAMPGIAHRARVSLEATERAMAKFMAPDPHSRSKEHEGRRIAETDRGWFILNYKRFREMRSAEARKLQNREAQRRWREKRRREKQAFDNAAGNEMPEWYYEKMENE